MRKSKAKKRYLAPDPTYNDPLCMMAKKASHTNCFTMQWTG